MKKNEREGATQRPKLRSSDSPGYNVGSFIPAPGDKVRLHLSEHWTHRAGLVPLSTRMIQQTRSHLRSVRPADRRAVQRAARGLRPH